MVRPQPPIQKPAVLRNTVNCKIVPNNLINPVILQQANTNCMQSFHKYPVCPKPKHYLFGISQLPPFKMTTSDFDRFINCVIRYFKLIGFEFDAKRLCMKLYLIAGLLNLVFILLGQVAFLCFRNLDLGNDALSITNINYLSAAGAKMTALICNRTAILKSFNEFRELYPSVHVIRKFNLQCYLNQYLLIERLLIVFFKSITFFYIMLPLFYSTMELISEGTFLLRIPMKLWYSDDLDKDYALWVLTYVLEIHATYVAAITILCSDLALFNCLLQLCMHFDIINRNIVNIAPDDSQEAEKELKIIIAYHQRVLRLAERVNAIFTPSVLFSLLSSSSIICFDGFDLLKDMSFLGFVRIILLLMYELKQVAIICFLGDKLIEMSSKTSEAIYEHKWYNGTASYKRLVLIALMRSQKSVALRVNGISDISLQTLRAVLSISYQIFTVLKTT